MLIEFHGRILLLVQAAAPAPAALHLEVGSLSVLPDDVRYRATEYTPDIRLCRSLFYILYPILFFDPTLY